MHEMTPGSSGSVVLGITSSAAAYKGVALASLLRRSGFAVDGILTAPAMELIGPAQLACARLLSD